MHRKQTFPDTKVWIVQNVHISVLCTVVFKKHIQRGSSCTIVSPFVHHIPLPKENQKHPKYDIFSSPSLTVCRTRPTKIIRKYQESKTQIVFFRCDLKLSVQCTWNQELLLSDRTVPKFTHYAQKSDTNVWIIQNVHNSVSCTVVFMKHVQSGSSCTLVSPFVIHISLAKRKPKTP